MPNIPIEIYAAVIATVFVVVELLYKEIIRPLLSNGLGVSAPTFAAIKPVLTSIIVILVSFGVALGFENYFLDYSDSISQYGAVFVMAVAAAFGSGLLDGIKQRLDIFESDEYAEVEVALEDGLGLEDLMVILKFIKAQLEKENQD